MRRLKALLQADADVCVPPQILQEILQGTRDRAQFDKYLRYFTSQPTLEPRDAPGSAVAAGRLYFDCRRRGIPVRSSNDCAIARIVLEHGVVLLRDDVDFRQIAQIEPKLREISG